MELRETIAGSTFDTINGPVLFKCQKCRDAEQLPADLKGIAQIIWPSQVKTLNFEPKAPWK